MQPSIKPRTKYAFIERLYEEETTQSGILTGVVRSNVNPFAIKGRIIEDNSVHELPKDTIVFCRFIGLQDMTGDEKYYIVHENFMEGVLE